MERLQKVLARAGVASRRACEEMISAGRVTVNGKVVTELGTKVEPDVDVLAIDGRVVAVAPALVYILLNKPVGYVSTTSDPQGRPTVLDLLATGQNEATPLARLFPVGRLDYDSEGLILLTNDGDLTQRLTHPRYGMVREYLVWIDGRPDVADLDRLRHGIPLDGKPAPVDAVEIVPGEPGRGQPVTLRITVHEGRKHEIRRLCEAIGYRVQRLQRVRMGPLRLGDLAPGKTRRLSREEISSLRRLTRLPQPSSPARTQAGPAVKTNNRRQHAPHS